MLIEHEIPLPALYQGVGQLNAALLRYSANFT